MGKRRKNKINLTLKQKVFLFLAIILFVVGVYVVVKTYKTPCGSNDNFGNDIGVITNECKQCVNNNCKKEQSITKNAKGYKNTIEAALNLAQCSCSKCDCNKKLCDDISSKGKEHIIKKVKKNPREYYRMAKPLMI